MNVKTKEAKITWFVPLLKWAKVEQSQNRSHERIREEPELQEVQDQAANSNLRSPPKEKNYPQQKHEDHIKFINRHSALHWQYQSDQERILFSISEKTLQKA